jgi:pSer/pThr/pTyr-binding forkhead associated (FHA) protein
VSEGLLTVLKFCFLALLYLFLFRVVRIVRLELKPVKVPAPVDAVAAAPAAGGKRDKRQEKDRKERGPQLYLLEPAARYGEAYVLNEELSVGRAPGCAVVLENDTFVSQVHARLFRRGRETYVEDLGSTNGTYVNGERIAEVTRLRKGDRVQFGNTVAEITR